MKKYILGLVFALLVSFSLADVTALGGLALQDVYLVNTANPAITAAGAASTSNIIGGNLPNRYTCIDFDSTSATLAYTLVTVNAKNTTDNPTIGNIPTARQFMILSCRGYTLPITVTVNSMIPAQVNNQLVFNTVGQTVLLQFNRADGYWHKIADSSASANAAFNVTTLTATNGTISSTLTTNILNGTTAQFSGNVTFNSTVTGNNANFANVTVNTIVGVSQSFSGTVTEAINVITTANISNFGQSINAQTYSISDLGTITANIGAISTANISTLNFTVCSVATPSFASIVTSAATISTGNINVPIIVKGVTVYLKANTSL